MVFEDIAARGEAAWASVFSHIEDWPVLGQLLSLVCDTGGKGQTWLAEPESQQNARCGDPGAQTALPAGRRGSLALALRAPGLTHLCANWVCTVFFLNNSMEI